MRHNFIFSFFILSLLFSLAGFAEESSDEREVFNETRESKQCCGNGGISYCDLSAGHYVCNDGGYSACICTQNTAVTAYPQFITGCCLWHGGIADTALGEVICQDGSRSEVCSINTDVLIGGSPIQ